MKEKATLLYFCSEGIEKNIVASLSDQDFLPIKVTGINETKTVVNERNIDVLLLDLELLDLEWISFLENISQDFPEAVVLLCGNDHERKKAIQMFNQNIISFYLETSLDTESLQKMIKKVILSHRRRYDRKQQIESYRSMFENMSFLHNVSQKLSEKKSLPILLHEIIESSKSVMRAEASSLLLYDPMIRKLHFVVVTGDQADYIRGATVEIGVGIAGWVAQHHQSLLIESCYDDPRFNPEYDKKSDFETRTMMCVPMVRKDSLLGVIQVINKKDGDFFSDKDLTVFETLASQCAIAIENAQLIEQHVENEAFKRELETARQIQERILPAGHPHFPDLDLAALLISAKQVGGDYYNLFRVSEEETLFVIADVTGKSIPAALLVSTVASYLLTYMTLYPDSFNLEILVTGLNTVLKASTIGSKYATCFFGLYNHNHRRMTYINAGHNPPLVFKLHDNTPIELTTDGTILGCFSDIYSASSIELHLGEVVVFYTDGVTEAWNQERIMYQEERLINCVNRHKSENAHQILNAIEEDMKRHTGQASQHDDITCVILKVR